MARVFATPSKVLFFATLAVIVASFFAPSPSDKDYTADRDDDVTTAGDSRLFLRPDDTDNRRMETGGKAPQHESDGIRGGDTGALGFAPSGDPVGFGSDIDPADDVIYSELSDEGTVEIGMPIDPSTDRQVLPDFGNPIEIGSFLDPADYSQEERYVLPNPVQIGAFVDPEQRENLGYGNPDDSVEIGASIDPEQPTPLLQ